MSEQYTHIPVMYRDFSNYKAHGEYVAKGAITEEQKARLKATLGGNGSDEDFIPAQVGCSHFGANEWALRMDSDGPWHEMYTNEIKVNDDPHPDGWGEDVGDIEDFVSKMEKAKADGWDAMEHQPEYEYDYDEDEDDYESDEDVYTQWATSPSPDPAPAPAPAASSGGAVDQARHPAGSGKGGQFAKMSTPEAGIELE